jgi:CO/xanthine dehydrogenase FAD-binding subunit
MLPGASLRPGEIGQGEVASPARPAGKMEAEELPVDFIQPTSWADALSAKAARPAALPVAGGTDVMVELNFDAKRPDALLDLTRVAELADWDTDQGRIRLGAGVTYSRVIDELGPLLPGLAMAARTVGSPQIRNRGTVGGNLGAASPAGDCHPPLLAAGAEIEVASVNGTRTIRAEDFYTGVKRNALRPDELIRAILITPPAGPQQFSKIGTRNAMVIAVAAFSLALHPDRRQAGTGIGSAAPTPRRAPDAERFLADALDEAGLWESKAQIPPAITTEFSRLVRAAAKPIDDVRGTAAYRLHALAVMASRTLTWAWRDYGNVAGRG